MTNGGSFSNNDLAIKPGSAVAHFDGQKYQGYGFDGKILYRRRNLSRCTDSDGNVNFGGFPGTRSCRWLQENFDRFEYLCLFESAAQNCPVTCGICD
mmetsp:Transcript_18802/g.38948  ORF Transcript_18802/g.38948 Transcript_18802/m.38948 type:complete len:97 (+) Transcript_18802:2-292(+)